MKIFRLLLDTFDFSDPSKGTWDLIDNLAECCSNEINHCQLQETAFLFEWITVQVRQDVKSDFIREEYDAILDCLSNNHSSGALAAWLKIGPDGAIETELDNGTNVLSARVIRASYCKDEQPAIGIIEALTCGADPNSVSMSISTSLKEHSPTSLSLYSTHGFNIWLIALREAKIDADAVFEKEIRQGILHDEGWTKETFQKFMDWEISHNDLPVKPRCSICTQFFTMCCAAMVQPKWVYALEEIKNGRCPNHTTYALSKDFDALSHSTTNSNSSLDVESDESGGQRFEKQICTEATQVVEDDPSEWETDVFLALHERFCEENKCLIEFSEDISRLEGDLEDENDAVPVLFDLETWSSLKNEDVVCMACWIQLLGIDSEETSYQSSEISQSRSDAGADTDTDASSVHDFSPLLFHS